VLLAGKLGKGKVVVNGMCPGIQSPDNSYDAKPCKITGPELTVLCNSIFWLTNKTEMRSTQLFESHPPVIGRRCVHLDLKGLPPTPERLIRLLKVFAAARYNSVLVEWEDAFPWTVDRRFRSVTAYSPAVVKKFVKTAEDLGMEIIPLVQCLGHMETPLRLPKYAFLRETPSDESVLNPLAPGACELIERMMDDVLTFMPNVKRFHLGGDEAVTFGTHPETRRYIARHGKGALYLHHVEPLLDRLLGQNIRPMLWHDMMREWDSSALRRLARKTDLVLWGYLGHPYAMMNHCNKAMIERFARHKIPLWGATAYKGADGRDIDLPDIDKREANALGWMEAARNYHFTGVIATAWSRWTASIFQNEPIDGALDSALNVGVILHDGKPPKGGIEACRRELCRMGEGRIFDRTRNALSRLGDARNNIWIKIRYLRQLLATVSQDGRRRPCYHMVKLLKDMANDLANAESASNDLRKALSRLLAPVWIKRYIAERMEPLCEEFASLEARVRKISPAAYNTLFHDR